MPGLALVLALFVQVQNLPKFLASSNISSKHHRVRCSKCEPAFATIHTANRWYSRHSPLQFRFFNACIDGFQRHNEVYRIVISKCCLFWCGFFHLVKFAPCVSPFEGPLEGVTLQGRYMNSTSTSCNTVCSQRKSGW